MRHEDKLRFKRRRLLQNRGDLSAAHARDDDAVRLEGSEHAQAVADAELYLVNALRSRQLARLLQAFFRNIRRYAAFGAPLEKGAHRHFPVIAADVGESAAVYARQNGVQPRAHYLLMKSLSFLVRLGWRSFLSAFASICLMRSRVTLNSLPTSSSVLGRESSSP